MQTRIEIAAPEPAATAERRKPTSIVSIRADAKAPILNVRELWSYRQVLQALVRREIKIRYAQTVVGVGWALLQPVLTTFVLTVLAGRWMQGPIGGINYSVFVFAGLVPWIYFTHVVTRSSVCLMNNNGLLSKAYFPRLLLPMAAVAGGLVDLFVMTVLLTLLMVYTKTTVGFGIILFPLCLLFLGVVAAGAGIWIAVLNLYHRDVAHALPFVTQLAFFLTPVAYSSKLVLHSWRFAYALNPMTGVVECFRWTLFAAMPDVSLTQLGISALAGIALLLSALICFSRKERILADVGDA